MADPQTTNGISAIPTDLLRSIFSTLKRGIECASYTNASVDNIGKFWEEADDICCEIAPMLGETHEQTGNL